MPAPATATSSSQAQSAASSQITLNLQEMLGTLFMVLTEKEVTVIKKRFALFGQPKQTLEKIGKHFKVTRERIRQIESIALSKLRRTVFRFVRKRGQWRLRRRQRMRDERTHRLAQCCRVDVTT